ncbi:MAG: M1 family aminopeptidase [bacterium]
MKKALLVIAFLLFLVGCSPEDTGIHDSANNVYSMDVYLDTENDTLNVEGELYYKNDDYDLEELYIHLYPNALNPRGLGDNVVFTYFRIDGEAVSYDITGTDHTTLHVALGRTLAKGERVSITYEYQFRYWDTDRIANYGNYYLTMFFYPSVAMKDAEGWHVEPYSFRGETYYNDIGDYYVTIDVPADYLIACGGEMVSAEVQAGRNIQEYTLLEARDFSFSASSDYHLYERTIAGIEYSIYAIRELTSVEIENSFTYLERTMGVMEREIGDYYYDHFTLEYGYFYGMESSGVIYCSSEIQEGTVVHEMVHQWFYSMIGNDQANESFLDEALTTYAVSLYYYDLYSNGGYDGYLDYRTSLKASFADRYQACLGVTLLREVDEYGADYGYLIYYHGPAMFRYYVAEFLDGDIAKMADILQTYYQEYAKDIATLDEFLDLLERESGVDITKEWFELQLHEFQDFDNRP